MAKHGREEYGMEKQVEVELPKLTGHRRYGRKASRLVAENMFSFMHIEKVLKDLLEREGQLRTTIAERDAALAESAALRKQAEELQKVYEHAKGMTFGEDWNKGTAAGYHRQPLIDAVLRIAELEKGEQK